MENRATDVVRVAVPAKEGYISTLRLTTASIAQQQGFDIEAVDDLRVCISEVLNTLLPSYSIFEVTYYVEEAQLRIVMQAPKDRQELGDLSLLILDSLMDHVEFGEQELVLVKNR